MESSQKLGGSKLCTQRSTDKPHLIKVCVYSFSEAVGTKLQQLGFLQPRKLFSHSSRSLEWEIKTQKDPTPPEGSRREFFLPLPGPGGSRCSLACGCITPVSASTNITWHLLCFLCVYLLLLVSSKDMWESRGHQHLPGWTHLEIHNIITKSPAPGLQSLGSGHISLGATIQPTAMHNTLPSTGLDYLLGYALSCEGWSLVLQGGALAWF